MPVPLARALAAALALCLAAASAWAAPPDMTPRADALLGIPYRPDGVCDASGRWTLFEHPEQSFPTPGLNCSGLVFTLMQRLSPSGVGVRDAARDRLGDSGPTAVMGQDWDFGFDLVLNLTDGTKRRWLTPEPQAVSPADTGQSLRGFALTDQGAWKRALAQVGPGQVCLVSFSQPGRRKGYTLQHYHVGVIVPDASGGRWLYQATPRSGTSKTNLASAEGFARFLGSFTGGDKRVLLLAVDLPGK